MKENTTYKKPRHVVLTVNEWVKIVQQLETSFSTLPSHKLWGREDTSRIHSLHVSNPFFACIQSFLWYLLPTKCAGLSLVCHYDECGLHNPVVELRQFISKSIDTWSLKQQGQNSWLSVLPLMKLLWWASSVLICQHIPDFNSYELLSRALMDLQNWGSLLLGLNFYET